MIEGLMLTIGSFLFVILLCIVYFSKQRFLSIRNKLYKYMLIVVVILIISEIIGTLLASYSSNNILIYTVYRIHWLTGIVWFSLLYFYSIVFINNIRSNSFLELIRSSKKNTVIAIIFLVLSLLYFIAPFDVINKDYISYMPGLGSYFIFAFCAFSVSLIVINLFRYKQASLRNKLSVWIMIIEMLIIFALQLRFPYIAFSPIGASIQMFFLYFNIENPDLKIIKELEVVKNDIEKASKAKSDFLSNMSHEIRSPMNAIVGFSSSLLNSPNFDSKTAREDIMHISKAGNNLLDIINNILDISKIESGADNLELKEYSIKNIVLELSNIINARIEKKSIDLIIDVDENIPSMLYGDSTKIFQILLNLLTNATKYTEVGKIKLIITSDINEGYANLHFKVSDTGYGIKKEDFDKLFSKFSRLDTAKNNEIEGTGLGLVITKKYVDLMDGKIWFESEYEVGTSFYVEIKQKIINTTKLGMVSESVKNVNKIDYEDYTGKKVLIVDDNKLNIKVAKRLLEGYKLEVDSVESGKECIYKIKEGKLYDMIFLDHMMPEMDGIEVLHVLRKLEDYNIPPIIALTANALTGVKEMYLKEGFDEYLSKPINIVELNKIIDKYFKK